MLSEGNHFSSLHLCSRAHAVYSAAEVQKEVAQWMVNNACEVAEDVPEDNAVAPLLNELKRKLDGMSSPELKAWKRR